MRLSSFLAFAVLTTAACDDSSGDLGDDDGVRSPAMAEPSDPTPQEMQTGDAPSAGGSETAKPAPTSATGAPIGDWVAGDYPPELRSNKYLTISGLPNQKGARGYKVHVPKGYDPRVPTPVVFAFHGLMQDALMFVVNGTGFVPKSDKEGFILVMPNGVLEGGIGGSWNAGVCCGASAQQKLDDVGFVRAIYAELQKHLNIDAGRVYATGLSNGGFLSHRLGCEAADLFVAIAPLAGSIGSKELGAIGTNPDPDFKTCTPAKPIAVLAMHGDADPIVPYAGQKRSLDHFAKANGCSLTTKPASQPLSAGDTTCVTYEGCAGVEVTGCTVAKGGHCWFGDPSCGTGAPGIGNLFVGNNSKSFVATDAAWDFLRRFRR